MRGEMGSWVMTLHLFLLLFLQLILLCVCGNAGKVPAIVVFGDSTVDAGNNNQIPTVLKSNFWPYGRDFMGGKPTGRFCNGRLATDFISQAFGLKPTVPAYLDPAYSIKDFATGVCFASAGTGYDNATSDVLSVIPFWKELEYFRDFQCKLKSYLGMEKAMEILNEALFILSIGTNDFLENYYSSPRQSSHFTIEQYENFLINIAEEFITDIYQLGARKISLTGLSPMGCLPLERVTNAMTGSVCVENYNNVARNFNLKLQMLANKLSASLPGLRLVYTHIYDTFLGVIHNPTLYGFDNVGVGCCATGMFEMGYLCDQWSPFTCKDASKYVFWDAFHPTEKMNLILAYHSMNTTLAQFL